MKHEAILGRTRTGKTYYAIHRAQELADELRGSAIMFDTKRSGPPAGGNWVQLGPKNTPRELRAERLAWYVPSDNLPAAGQELAALVEVAAEDPRPTVMVVDEAQIWAPSGSARGPCQDIARVGAGPEWQILGMFTAQRPADLSKSVLTQCERIVVFAVDHVWESNYWDSRVSAQAWARVQECTAGQYQYAVIEAGTVTGPHKI